ncbi:hypothetical protein [Neobacillus rhizosphaerae]|nr:hypothetical protein [Neobacillus rhizosphaerae]
MITRDDEWTEIKYQCQRMNYYKKTNKELYDFFQIRQFVVSPFGKNPA